MHNEKSYPLNLNARPAALKRYRSGIYAMPQVRRWAKVFPTGVPDSSSLMLLMSYPVYAPVFCFALLRSDGSFALTVGGNVFDA